MRTLVALLLMTGAAQASLCADRQQMLDNLASRYGEKVVATGILGDQGYGVAELLIGPQSWSIILTVAAHPDVSCLELSGVNWSEKPKGEPL